MAKKTVKLNYKYSDAPHTYYKTPHLWGQELRFRGEFTCPTKKELLKKRAAIVRDVAKVFAKHGIDTECFNIQNDWI